MDYGREYDLARSFWEQYRDLLVAVPRPMRAVNSAVNSDYSNYLEEAKNAYLSYSVLYNSEDVWYSKNVDRSRIIVDSFDVSMCERCYECVSGEKNYNCTFAYSCRNCIDSDFVYDCLNCQNCFLCTNLRNKQYYFENREYSREEYEARVSEFRKTHDAAAARAKFRAMSRAAVHRFMDSSNATGCTGNNLNNCKNTSYTFNGYGAENVKFGFRTPYLKDSFDATNAGRTELLYEFIGGGGASSQNIFFCTYSKGVLISARYVDNCTVSKNLFGCIALRNKENCILNKQYSPEAYTELVSKIIEDMQARPYVDTAGRSYQYGEFFPPEFSPFAYNETVAQEYFPLNAETAVDSGWAWKDSHKKQYEPTIKNEAIPLKPVQDNNIVNEVLECAHMGKCSDQCTGAFRLTVGELDFYRGKDLPLPRLCPNCRHFERLAERTSLKLWHRRCMCNGADIGDQKSDIRYQNSASHVHGDNACPNEFETAYSPERPETVYCEACYNSEVA